MTKKPDAKKPSKPKKDEELSPRDLEKVSGGMMRMGTDTSNTALQADITPDKGDGCDKA